MNLNQNDTGVLKFGDNSTARVKVVSIDYSPSGFLSTDYWFEYEEGETNRQIIHPDLGKTPIIKSSIVLPEKLVELVFVKDGEESIVEEYRDEYEQLLDAYLDRTMRPEDKETGRNLFKRLESLMSKEQIIAEYFKK